MSSSAGSASAVDGDAAISKQEQEVYDRQIRLWGMEAQNKLRNSSVLVCGLSGLGAEVVKNLMLAGLKGVTLMDDVKVREEDKLANFLLPDENFVGQNRAAASAERARALNPMVRLEVIEDSPSKHGKETWSQYELVILIDQGYDLSVRVDGECREANVRFMAGSVFGAGGYAFFDFNGHQFLFKQQRPEEVVEDGALDVKDDGPCAGGPCATTIEEDTFEKREVAYPSMRAALNVEWNSKKFMRRATRLVPSCYYPIRAAMRLQGSTDKTTDDEVATLTSEWKKQLETDGQMLERQPYTDADMECFVGAQVSPVCAIVGGIMGQEAIKTLSENQIPLRNLFLYSALDTAGMVCIFPPA